MRIAVEGCAHGELEKIYETIAAIEKQENYKVDLLLCCGDFQATRNLDDLNCMAVPKKFQEIGTFYKYYSGEKTAPMLTIFIGGNHEASNYLQELPYGGWVAPNIYYLGYASVVNFKGIRIGGMSGIYKGFDFFKGHFENPPYDNSTMRSVYHYRQQEVFRLKQIGEPIDVIMSHDWPQEVYNYGNAGQLIRFKPHFRDEIHDNKLGSPPCWELLKRLKPTYWFAGHLHCKFAAVIPHEDDSNDKTTKFLALDKCLPNRRFLQVIEIEEKSTDNSEASDFQYDLEWLTILYLTKHLTDVKPNNVYMPGEGNTTVRWNFRPTEEEKQSVLKRLNGNLSIPQNFERTAAPYNPDSQAFSRGQPAPTQNSQTIQFCNLLDIDDPLQLVMILAGNQLNQSTYIDNLPDTSFNLNESVTEDANESTLNSTASSALGGITSLKQRLSLFDTLPSPKNHTINPDETILEFSDEDEPVKAVGKSDTNDVSVHLDMSADLSGQEDNDSSMNQSTEISSEDMIVKRVSGVEEPMASTPAIKKFKRRNASIYDAESED